MRRHTMWSGWVHSSGRVGAVMLCLLLPGCLVQKADLTKVEQSLSDRIKNLDKQAQELQTKMTQASADIDRLIGETSARLSSEIHEMRDEELPKFQGKLEDTLYQLNNLAGRMDDRAVKMEQLQAKRDAEGEKRFTSIEKALKEELAKLTATITAMAKTVDARLQEHDKAIAGQSKAMGALGDKMVQQDQRTETLTEKVEADAKATTAHLAEVNKSIVSITKTLEAVGGKFQTKVQEQDRHVEEIAKSLGQLQTEIGELTRAVHDLRGAKDSAPKKGNKQGKRSNEETRDSRVGQLHDPSQSGDTPAQGTEPIAATSLNTTPAPVGEIPPADQDGEIKQVYDRSLQQFKQGDLNGALQGFSDFLVQHPASDLAPNAQYWIGECWYGKKDFGRAIEAYDRVRISYPTSEKVPAAILKKAYAYLGMKDRKRASSTLRQVVDAYPRSPEAGKASEKLAQLKFP